MTDFSFERTSCFCRRMRWLDAGRDWREGFAQDLRGREFAGKVRMAGPNVLRAIHPRHNPTHVTLNRLLKPFRLRLSLARVDQPQGRHAA